MIAYRRADQAATGSWPAYSVTAGTGKARKKRTTPYVRDGAGRFILHEVPGQER